MKYINKFYLDKEKDIIVKLYKEKQDEIIYVIETPNHHTGNLITNIANICGLETIQDKNNLKVIKGVIPASLNGDGEEVYILRIGGIKIANIYENGKVEIKAKIPAITKTLMSQTKDYKLPANKTIVKSYILKKSKLKTDLHTHMNANLSPDCLIALGIKHQIEYPLYYIKKLNLKLTNEQEEKILKQREKVEKEYENSELVGKYLTRKIDDNTFINFADFILNNIENAEENIAKIRASLAILKDGQAVFTNLEKVYIYRYVFAKGKTSKTKIKLLPSKIEKIPENDIKQILKNMLEDEKDSTYKNNTLRQDKLLWIAREYKKQGITYVEIADTDLANRKRAPEVLEQIHNIMPKIEEETGVAIRFLAGIRRIPLTIIRDQKTNSNYLRENLDVIQAVGRSPYVVGSDFIGEEINDISELKPVIEQLVQYAITKDEGFTIRIHAGENDSLKENVAKSVKCVKESLKPGQKMPKFRIGHGVYTQDFNTKEGQELVKLMKETGVVVEFQLTSNVRLNNLTTLKNHPLKKYLENNIKCVQGTDGYGFYGTDTIDEQLALANLLNLTDKDFEEMKKVEDAIIEDSQKYFKKKSKKLEKFLNGRTIKQAFTEEIEKNIIKNANSKVKLRINDDIEAEVELKNLIKKLPEDKLPIVIAGGSFNAKGVVTKLSRDAKLNISKLIEKLDSKKVYFVIGHTMQGYEKALIDVIKKSNKKFEIFAIVPKMISKQEKVNILNENIDGVRISTEGQSFGIYKSFNYEIFERRTSIVIVFDGNSPALNLIQEAKNGKGKSKIFVNEDVKALKEKAKSLHGYVETFKKNESIENRVLEAIKYLKNK